MHFPRLIFHSETGAQKSFLATVASICFCIILLGLTLSTHAEARSVRTDFNKARAYFEAGKLEAASKLLKAILRRYPDHKASYYLLGRIYYRANRIKKSARYFSRAGTDYLSTGGAFEYGLVMFTVKNCTKALKGFARVPKGPSKDLAYFYSGVCHIRAKSWFQAENYLRRATKLPPNLQVTKRRFLSEIQRKRSFQRSGAVPRAVPYVPVPLPPPQPYQYYDQYQYPPPLPGGPGAPPPDPISPKKPKKKKKPEPPKILTGFSTSVIPKLEYLNETETQDRHQTGDKTVTKRGPVVAGDAQARYDFAPDKTGRQMGVVVNLVGEVRSLDKSSKDVTFTESTEGESLQKESVEATKDKALKYTLKPQLNYPIGQTLELVGGVLYAEEWPEMKQELKVIDMGGFGNVSFTISDIDLKLLAELTNREKIAGDGAILTTSDTKLGGEVGMGLPANFSFTGNASQTNSSEPTYESLDGFGSQLIFGGAVSRGWEKFSLDLNATNTSNTPGAGTAVDGIQEELKLEVTGSSAFSLGVTLSATVEYAQIGSYVKTGLRPTDSDGVLPDESDENVETKTATASGTRQGFSLNVGIAPIDWAYANASYTSKETVFNVGQKELQTDFQVKVTDLKTVLKLVVGITTSF